MEWIRYHPKAAAISAGVLTLVVIVMLWSWIGPSNETADAGGEVPTVTPTPLPTVSPSATPTKKPKPVDIAKQVNQGLKGIPGNQTGAQGSGIGLPGLSGGSAYANLPRHTLVMYVRSEAPIGTVGYIIPTSLRKNYGVVKNVGTGWSLTTTVYGEPDYGQIYLQAGARGFPITCTITIDGKVTESRSTDGPYGQLLCQG